MMARSKGTVSMKDVAALAGVSVGTVSNVLNSPALVADATRERVEAAISKLGWVRNESARQLRAGHSRSIGMIVLDIANPFFADLLTGVEDFVHERGYTVQLGNSASQAKRETEHLELFEQHRVRGLLLAPVGERADWIARYRQRGIPVILVDRVGERSDCCSVAVDDVEGGRLAVSHLLQQGHQRIAVVGGPTGLTQVRDRRLGSQLAAGSSGRADALLMLSTPRLDVASGVAAAGDIAGLPDNERPTAVFAVNDLLAIGLLQGFVTLGFRVPEDVAIIGYDDIAFAAAAAVPLSSIRQPRHSLGQRAVELLFEEVDAMENERDHEHHQVQFTPELVVRRSTAASRTAEIVR